jgi:hypothetical protein
MRSVLHTLKRRPRRRRMSPSTHVTVGRRPDKASAVGAETNRMTPPPLYKIKSDYAELKSRLKVFDKNMVKIMRTVQRANTAAGIHKKRTMSRGGGMFTANGIKKNSKVFLYWGNLVDYKTFKGPLTYCYGADITNSRADIGIEGKGREAELKGGEWEHVNGIHINHSCKAHNLKSMVCVEKVSGLRYIAFATREDIAPGAELLSNYNEGKSHKKYWRIYTTLKRYGVDDARIVRCKCRSALKGRKCPLGFAYDKAEMQDLS